MADLRADDAVREASLLPDIVPVFICVFRHSASGIARRLLADLFADSGGKGRQNADNLHWNRVSC
jgi:hypothetical protein